VQERYNELDVLEQRKSSVREQIEALERAHAERIAADERELQHQRRVWAERRAEAEKARELYERNNQLLEQRMADVIAREEEHTQRSATLAAREKELEKRGREVESLRIRAEALEEQRQSLNATIASLTAKAGAEWARGGIAPGIGVLEEVKAARRDGDGAAPIADRAEAAREQPRVTDG
jgi:hypothetical protein